MSHHPAYTMSGLCYIGGAIGYARSRSLYSVVAGVTIGSAYALCGMRIQEGMSYGYEGATGTSLALLGAALPRAIRTRLPVPIVLSVAATATAAYYGKQVKEFSA